MKTLTLIALAIAMAACGAPDMNAPENTGVVEQAVTANYHVAAIQWAYSPQHLNDHYDPVHRPDMGYGGLAAQVRRISRFDQGFHPPQLSARGVYPYITYFDPVFIDNLFCNGDAHHDQEYLLTQACGSLRDNGVSFAGYQHLWLQPPTAPIGGDAPGCNVIIPNAEKAPASIQQACGVGPTVGVMYNVLKDGPTDPNILETDSVTGALIGYPTAGIVHEFLHGVPSISPGALGTGHDNRIYCTTGKISQTNPACTTYEYEGQRGFLAEQGDHWAHMELLNESIEVQRQFGWLPTGFETGGGVVTWTSGQSGNITLNASDTNTIAYPMELRIPRLNGRFINVEHRSQEWIGGCPQGQLGGVLPCMTVNKRGVYVSITDELVGGSPPPTGIIPERRFLVQWSTNSSDTTYQHLRPWAEGQPPGTCLPIDLFAPGSGGFVCLQVVSTGTTSSVVKVNIN